MLLINHSLSGQLVSYHFLPSNEIECAPVMGLCYKGSWLDEALSVFLCLSTPSKIFISWCDLRHCIREYVIGLDGPWTPFQEVP